MVQETRDEPRRILVINPGSTSTKVSLFLDTEKHAEITEDHSNRDLASFERLQDQLFFREGVIRRFMRRQGWKVENLDAVVGRGGLLHPIDGGVYAVGPDMLADLRAGRYGEHASNLGPSLAREIADRAECPAFTVDPVVVDELDDPARLSGHPELPRRSVFHALNQRSVARKVAEKLGKRYEECRFIVAHMGGGITVGAHAEGRVIEVNNGLDGDGPFTPERTGSLPVGQIVSVCFRSGKTEKEIRRMIKGGGGLVAYTGSNDVRRLVSRVEEEENERPEGSPVATNRSQESSAGSRSDNRPDIGIPASVILEAFCRQIAQAVCAHGATLEGRVDAVIFTGGVAYSDRIGNRLKELCGWMAPIEVVPGEREMEALAEGAVRALDGEEEVKEYVGEL